jgi:hypothetical protein
MADQLCTTAQVKARLGITDATDDTVISELIDQVSSWIEGYTRRSLVPIASADYYFDTTAGYVLRVPIGIRAITFMGVASTHQPDAGGTYVTVPAADYLLRPRESPIGWPFFEVWMTRGVLSGTVQRFQTVANGCKLTMTAGFAVTPPDIQSVTIDAVVAAKQAMSDGASSVIGADDITIAPWKDYFGRGSPQRMTLDSYRDWNIV